ncbi:hypothetical protein GCM10010495_08260 [Kitasatospora herbaricolor]|uniref:hypothetical protein n=1 Tax=Kitasatospora herbaricolor TaxID=68217 RepID=UPI0017496492|nr:hypothetical protein [Kitasatospora herbaricolor]MDQ0309738.1 ferric-dicitrate binding protein FerR (iron transport regulator) [Kitasatospora herbaricolor]GGU99921.1 hypothetical protein GCM10010495_08260 [Kitasatospora herbaricolor]
MSNDNHSLVPREDDNSPIAQVELLSSAPDARDITAELAAPPRRRLPWVTLALAGGVLAAAAFSGGVWYQQNHGSTKTAAGGGGQQRAAAPGGYGGQGAAGQGTGRRNGQAGGTGAAGGAGVPGGTGAQGGAGGFTRGTVKVVDGTTVYLTDANGNTVKVTTGDSTKVQLNKEGKVGDLQPGQSVTVVGTPDASGGYAATQLVEGAAAGGFGGFGGARTPSGG